jgi:hypothetical protein
LPTNRFATVEDNLRKGRFWSSEVFMVRLLASLRLLKRPLLVGLTLSVWETSVLAQSAPVERAADGVGIGVWAALAKDSPGRPFGHSVGNDLALTAIRATFTVHRAPGWALDYSADLVPAAWISMSRASDAAVDRPCQPDGSACEFRAPFAGQQVVYGIGTAPLGIVFRIRPRRHLQPFLTAAAGALWFQRPVPAMNAGRFNFTAELGGGVLYTTSHSLGVLLGYKLQHLSNGGTRPLNPGIDSNMFYVGLTRIWRRAPDDEPAHYRSPGADAH